MESHLKLHFVYGLVNLSEFGADLFLGNPHVRRKGDSLMDIHNAAAKAKNNANNTEDTKGTAYVDRRDDSGDSTAAISCATHCRS